MDGLTEYRQWAAGLRQRDPLSQVDGRAPLQRMRLDADACDGIARDYRGALRDRIDCVRWTPLHGVALRGGCTIGGERYVYLPADDALVREEAIGRVTT